MSNNYWEDEDEDQDNDTPLQGDDLVTANQLLTYTYNNYSTDY